MCCWVLGAKIREKFLTFLKEFKCTNLLFITIFFYFNVKFFKLLICSHGLKKLNDLKPVLLLMIHIKQTFFHHHTLVVQTCYRKIFT